MKRLIVFLALIALATPALADELYDLQVAASFPADRPYQGGSADRDQTIYSNITNYTGNAFLNGGAALISGYMTTKYCADDLVRIPFTGTQTITKMTFSVANLNSVAVSARARIRFHKPDGANGGPGTYITGWTFNAYSFNANTVYTMYFTPGTTMWTDSPFWAGITFDDNAAGLSATVMNNLGQGIWDPPTVGSSADKMFLTTAASVGNVNNPPGSVYNSPFAGAPNANFGWEFIITPEPTSLVLLALGALALRRR